MWAQPLLRCRENLVYTLTSLTKFFLCAQHSSEVCIGSIRDMGEGEGERLNQVGQVLSAPELISSVLSLSLSPSSLLPPIFLPTRVPTCPSVRPCICVYALLVCCVYIILCNAVCVNVSELVCVPVCAHACKWLYVCPGGCWAVTMRTPYTHAVGHTPYAIHHEPYAIHPTPHCCTLHTYPFTPQHRSVLCVF